MTVPPDENSPAIQRILALLSKKSGMSANDISREAFVGLTTLACGGYLKALRNRQLVHVSGWRKTRKGFVTPLFSLGHRPDLPRPIFKDEDRNSDGMNLIVAALAQNGAMTYIEAAKATGLSPNTIKNAHYMDILVKQRRIYICDWKRNRAGPMTAVYAAGCAKSVEKPPPFSKTDKNRRCREKNRALSDNRGLAAQLLRI